MVRVIGPWLATVAAADPCAAPTAPDAAFRVAPRADRVQVVVEVRPVGAPDGWTDAVLDALERRGVAAVVLLPAGADPGPFAALLARVGDGPHELGVLLPEALTPTSDGELRALRDAVAPLARAAGERPRTAEAAVGRGTVEALLGRAGFRVLLDATADVDDVARPATHTDGRPPSGVVLAPGPWDEAASACAPFRPGDADHLARVLERAQRLPGVPVVRWTLLGRGGDVADAAVVERWLGDVGLASGARFGTGEAVRPTVLTPPKSLLAAPPAGRSVELSQVLEAAAALRDPAVVPPHLPGGLTPTEAFLAFAVRVAGADDTLLQVPLASGPAQGVAAAAGPDEVIDREALVAWARALLEALPTELPSAARIGGRVYPAREVLLALASAVRGEDPVVTRPVADPDPNARGLGWGP